MGIFNLFKKKTPEIKEIKKIDFNLLEHELELINLEIKEQEKKVLEKIDFLVKGLVEELSREIEDLKKIDLSKKKAEDRIKNIVKDNLEKYTSILEKLKNNLSIIYACELSSIEERLEKINQYFDEFDKRSYFHFEKATYLIGDELGKTKESLKLFFKEINLLVSSEYNLDKKNTLNVCIQKLEAINSNKKIIESIEKENIQSQKRIDEIREEIDNLEINSLAIKKSERYKEFLAKKEKKESLKKELISVMGEIKQKVSLKDLAGIYHSSEKSMMVIRSYNNNFYESFERSLGTDLLELIDARDREYISKKISFIIEIKNKLADFKEEEDNIEEINKEIEKRNLETSNLESEIYKNSKKIKQIEEKINEIKLTINKNLENLGIEISL